MRKPQVREHVLFVHAHSDDETISTGGTIATLLDVGAGVTIVTCTRGEHGEVIPEELRHLSGDALGEYRAGELAQAMCVLGVGDFRFLGDSDARAAGADHRRYRDSGMQWGLSGAEPLPEAERDHDVASAGLTLTSADLADVVADVVAVIAEVQPTAVVSYDSRGGYGHPDHVRAHEAASAAALMADIPYFSIVPAGQGVLGDIRVDVSKVLERKKQALRAHRTQLTVKGNTIVHSGGQVEPISEIEVYRSQKTPRGLGVEWASLGVVSRVVACLIALFLGGIIGMICTANYQFAWPIVPLSIVALFVAGLRLLFASRIVATFAACGLVGVVWVLSQPGPGGAILVPANPAGYIWAYGPMIVTFLVLVWPRPGTFSRATMGKGSNPGKDVRSQ